MPTYGYQCTQCDNAFETVQKITADPLTTCDNCGGALRKKIFPVGIAFKGSGFYVNDYAKSTGGSQTATTAAATDTKPDTTTSPASGAETSGSSPAAPAPAAASSPESSSPAAPAAASSSASS